MILVIADDLTGAVELAGIALRFGLKTVVCTGEPPLEDADVLVLAADTRSAGRREAEEYMAGLTRQAASLRPELIFKKVDSVLRGHVTAEMEVHLHGLGLQTALLIPANPLLGRTIENGTYLLRGEPLHLSGFSADPEFAVRTSDVREMLGESVRPVNVLKKGDNLNHTGILVGEVAQQDDLHFWAERVTPQILAAGAAGFFEALLERFCGRKARVQPAEEEKLPAPQLIVCGSAFAGSKAGIKQTADQGGPVSYMPSFIVHSDSKENSSALYDEWAHHIIRLIMRFGYAVVAIDPSVLENYPGDAASLRLKTAVVVERVFRRLPVKELLIEGGSTAAAVLGRLRFSTFNPVLELAPGVIRMAAREKEGLYVTMKPGSYQWAPALRSF